MQLLGKTRIIYLLIGKRTDRHLSVPSVMLKLVRGLARTKPQRGKLDGLFAQIASFYSAYGDLSLWTDRKEGFSNESEEGYIGQEGRSCHYTHQHEGRQYHCRRQG